MATRRRQEGVQKQGLNARCLEAHVRRARIRTAVRAVHLRPVYLTASDCESQFPQRLRHFCQPSEDADKRAARLKHTTIPDPRTVDQSGADPAGANSAGSSLADITLVCIFAPNTSHTIVSSATQFLPEARAAHNFQLCVEDDALPMDLRPVCWPATQSVRCSAAERSTGLSLLRPSRPGCHDHQRRNRNALFTASCTRQRLLA